MHALQKQFLVEAHRTGWKTFWMWLGFTAAFVAAELLLVWSVGHAPIWQSAVLMLLVAHLMHSQLLAFHEAAHGVLCPSRPLNELVGLLIAKFHFNGLTLFRAVHETHHAHLGTEKDEQLWPFVHPAMPRWSRRLAAACELSLGIFYDAFLFWRAFLRKDTTIRNPRVRRRIWAEGGLMATFWTCVLAAVAWWHAWSMLLVMYVIPAFITGNLHSWRKYIEHMGLTGNDVAGLSRSIAPTGPLGRLLAFTMFNISYHQVHHYYGRLPQSSLPSVAARLHDLAVPQRADSSGDGESFPNYTRACLAMLPCLADPRIGPQWNHTPPQAHPLAIAVATTSHVA